MTSAVAEPAAAAILEREMFTEAEAARLLRVSQATLNYWLEGGTRRGKHYPPVIREKPRGGHAPLTWAEFIEAGWLRQYRRAVNVPMRELRAFITQLRDKYGIPYPLAHAKPFANQGQLVTVYEAQDQAGLTPEFCLVAEVSGQYVLTAPSEAFVHHVDWEDGIAVGWRPHEEPKSPVRMRPDTRFGRPAVRGVSTEVLWEQVEAGASFAEVAKDFNLTTREVSWAVSYETAAQAA